MAVAYAAHRLGVPAKIFVPTVSDPAKIERIRRLGADLVVGGDRYADALAAAQSWAAGSGAMSVHAFDQRETLLGQGSLGLELAEQVDELDTVLVPVGGGGLIAGVAAYFAGAVRVVGVEPDGAPTLSYARARGEPTDAPTGSVAADALAPRRVGDLVFPIVQRYVATSSWSTTSPSGAPDTPCGRRCGWSSNPPPRSASPPSAPAPTDPSRASASPSCSAAPTPHPPTSAGRPNDLLPPAITVSTSGCKSQAEGAPC